MPPLNFSDIFPQAVGNLYSPNFTSLLHVPIYAGLQFFYSIICNFDEVMPYKRDHHHSAQHVHDRPKLTLGCCM